MHYYIQHQGQQLGPLTEAEVRVQLASGALSRQDYVWWEGQATWVPLGQTPLVVANLPLHAPAVPHGPALSYTDSVAMTSTRTSGYAIGSLVTGLLSIFCCFNVFTSVPAIVLGHLGLNEIRKKPALAGRGMALAGLIIGYVMTAFFLLSFLISLVLMAAGVNVTEVVKSVQTQIQNGQSGDDDDSSTNSSDSDTNAPPVVKP